MLWWDPVAVSTPLLTTNSKSMFVFSCLLSVPSPCRDTLVCSQQAMEKLECVSVTYQAPGYAWAHGITCISNGAFQKVGESTFCWWPFLFLYCQKWECFYKGLIISVFCVHHWTPVIHTVMYDSGNGLACFKCNSLAVSLKNSLFTGVFYYDHEKLVNAVLKTLWNYLPPVFTEGIQSLAGNWL